MSKQNFIANMKDIDLGVEEIYKQGHRLLQFFKFAPDERSHIDRLLRWAELPLNAKVIDLGSGTGEVTRVMKEIRPDLSFCLVNLSEYQLSLSDEKHKHCCDFCNVPEPDGAFDAAMFCTSIGHAEIGEALKEASRLLKNGGVLFISDLVKNETGKLNIPSIEYNVYCRADLEDEAQKYGLNLDFYMEPIENKMLGEMISSKTLNAVLNGAIPANWRFVKS
jgi:ubiquinone/menaquinone biosynthesis C-methylase UbiE